MCRRLCRRVFYDVVKGIQNQAGHVFLVMAMISLRVGLFSLLLGSPLFAGFELQPTPEPTSGSLTFYLDNDLFGGRDKDYTNGARLSWISGDREVSQLGAAQRFLRTLSGDPDSYRLFRSITGFKDPSAIRYNYGFAITQLMFTPDDFASPRQPEGERRYAGWLGFGFSLHVRDADIVNSIEYAIGTTGANSLAENSQDFIHDLRSLDKFNGWDDQIPNEITFDISFEQKRRARFLEWNLGPLQGDGYTQWGMRLGTFQTGAKVGAFTRIGFNLPRDFSDPRLSSTAYSHRYFGSEGATEGNWSFFLLFGAGGQAVLHDATLDGPLFRHFDTGNTRVPFIGEVSCGFGIRYKAVEFNYLHTWRTEEYKEQASAANFGSVAIGLRF